MDDQKAPPTITDDTRSDPPDVLITLPGGDAAENPDDQKIVVKAKQIIRSNWFRPGEIVIIRGYRMRIKKVKPGELTLKVVSKGQ